MSEDDNVIRVNFGGTPPPPEAPKDPSAAEKLIVFTAMIDASTVMVTLDARIPGTTVPPQFADQLQLNLNFSYDYGIRDFAFDATGIRASLSFGGVNHWCEIPWAAVYMLRGDELTEAVAFPDSLPSEVRALIPQFEALLEEE